MTPPFHNSGNSTLKLTIPKGFPELLQNLSLEILRHQPVNIVEFAAQHFSQLLEERKSNADAEPRFHDANGNALFKNTNHMQEDDSKVQDGLEEQAACMIQKNFRGFVDRKKIKEEKKLAEIDTSKSNGTKKISEYDSDQAASTIQKHYRGYVDRKKFKEEKKRAENKTGKSSVTKTVPEVDPEQAASTIQKHYRGYLERKKINEKKRAANIIKKSYHKHYIRRTQSAAKIQSNFRKFNIRKAHSNVEEVFDRADALGLEASATKIQAAFRGHQVRKKLKEERKTDQEEIKEFLDDIQQAAIVIQKNYKGYMARKKFRQNYDQV